MNQQLYSSILKEPQGWNLMSSLGEFLSGVTSGVQQCYVRQINTGVLLAKNSKAKQTKLISHYLWGHIYTPSLQVLSRVCHIKTSFYLCLLQENTLSRVCSSKTYFHCVCFRKTVFHVSALARYPFTCVS